MACATPFDPTLTPYARWLSLPPITPPPERVSREPRPPLCDWMHGLAYAIQTRTVFVRPAFAAPNECIAKDQK